MHPKRLSYKDPKYEEWIRNRPCSIKRCHSQGRVDPHHNWHARGNDYLLLPLCREHHTRGPYSYHYLEHEKFEQVHGITIEKLIVENLVAYLGEKEGDEQVVWWDVIKALIGVIDGLKTNGKTG